jgi:PAS domain S-box-containing protein
VSGTLPEPGEILDQLVDTVFVVDPHGRLMYVSASCEELLGYAVDELAGTYMVEHVHPDDRGRTLNAVWRIMSGESIARFENRWIHKLGHSVPIQWCARWDAAHQVRIATGRKMAVDWNLL